jgi:hypothetical protein
VDPSNIILRSLDNFPLNGRFVRNIEGPFVLQRAYFLYNEIALDVGVYDGKHDVQERILHK